MQKRRWLSRFFAGIVTIAMLSCPALFNVQAQAEEEITFAMLPQMSNTELFKCWKPILDYLQKETGVKFKQVFAKDFTEHIAMCKEGKISFAYSNPFTYVTMSKRSKEQPNSHKVIAIGAQAEGPTFAGEIIVNADNSTIKTVKDIKGKKGMVVGYDSAGGYLFQQGYAIDNGINLPKDCVITEAPGNKQERVITAVIGNEVDFGCIRDGMRQKVKDKMDISKVKVLATTPQYPNWVVSNYEKVDPKIVEKVSKALQSIPADIMKEAALPGGIKSFVKAVEKDMDSIRRLSEKTGQ
ncbi:MAG: hypothetical protein A2219_07380 [Elusimicrobia bacterium RIFOXYA2_FULL_50_26]|nr:MAG: hypothetical protein A2219_07380 [Elusimicrobia bacterium RIFOXYA2_FULL_50_26]OGS23135.1 MAG: hypothetical protein A2314_04850 [Elusimicrobia bacterium RIFOXYB2_FULL_50_12]